MCQVVKYILRRVLSTKISFAWAGKSWKCLHSTSISATLTRRSVFVLSTEVCEWGWGHDCEDDASGGSKELVNEKWNHTFPKNISFRSKLTSGWGVGSGHLYPSSLSSHPAKTGLILILDSWSLIPDPWSFTLSLSLNPLPSKDRFGIVVHL